MPNISYNFPQFNHNIIIYYNSTGPIIRDETYKSNVTIDHNNYAYNSRGQITYLYKDNGEQNFLLHFGETFNCHHQKLYIPDEYTGKVEIHYNHFLYDTNKKTTFNIDEIFQIENLPGFGNKATLAKNISGNNITKHLESGTT